MPFVLFVRIARCQEYFESDNHYQYTIKINSSLPDFVFSVFLDTLKNTGESTGTVSRIEVRSSTGNQIIQKIKISGELPMYSSDSFYAKDMNFDGYLDILLNYAGGSAGEQFHVWLYNPKSGTFKRDLQFDNLWDPETIPDEKVVTSTVTTSYESTEVEIYHVENNKLVLLREEEKEYLGEVNGNKRWLKTTKPFKYNKPLPVIIDTLKEEE